MRYQRQLLAASAAAACLWCVAPDRAAAQAPATMPAEAQVKAADEKKADRPEIEVVFVLDTTGSMSGLIEGAKQKIWSMANLIIAMEDKPRIKIGLIGYRDRGDEYVTKRFDLTDDIDAVFKNLNAFTAGGGNDTPESVNQALDEAVGQIKWSGDDKVTKIIFLVGDAPPHMDYKDDVKYADSCAAAAKRGIRVNAVQCGAIGETTPIWREIAKIGKGSYIALEQEGGMAAITAPQDKELAQLNAQVVATVIAYGERAQQREVDEKVKLNSVVAAEPAVAARLADRITYNLADEGKAIQGRGDLVWACNNGVVKIEEIKPDELPPEMRKMTPAECKTYIAQKQAEREALQKRIADLTEKREAYITTERARMAREAPATAAPAFDLKVGEVVKEQRK